MQTPQAPIPTPPAPPAPPAPGVVDFTNFPGGPTLGLQPGMPITDAQRDAIMEARSLMSDQLISASDRRNAIAEALKKAEGADRAGLESRLKQLDSRILQIENDLAETGRLLTSAPPAGDNGLFAGTLVPPREPPGLSPGNITAISIVFTLFVLAPMALAAARLMWRRAVSPRPPAQSLESIQRLERVEQALDAVAVEVERISEGQRFVTRILTEGPAQNALNAAQRAEPVGVPREASRVPREKL